MIWIIWFLWIEVETSFHALLINKGIDPTPDKPLIEWRKLLVYAARIVPFCLLYLILGEKSNIQFILLAVGCFAMHSLIFPIQLNKMTGKDAHHLGKGLFDSILARVFPFLAFRVFSLVIILAGMIDAYYHPEKLSANYWGL